MKKLWHDTAWSDCLSWQSEDKKTLRKINILIKDIERNGYRCMGKVEPLKGNLSGWWACRIDEKNRLVFRLKEEALEIAACKGHHA
ncbi:MAG: Txe/YoeB family addiction module toxin [Cystobacterineae bacterium]|nr:Txe/YoeB family addiction module toxin [Cystobacterineae bacterium]